MIAMFLWVAIYTFFIGTGPLILSFVQGDKRELTYAVDGLSSGYRGCDWGVNLENLPFWNKRLCGVPADIRNQLSRCDRITVEGIGTRFGLRVTRIVAVQHLDEGVRISTFEDCPM